MRELTLEEIKIATEGKGITEFIEKIKEMPVYSIYEKAVKNKKEHDTATLLQASVMFISMIDKELSAMMLSVSSDLLFDVVDHRLRKEILKESEEENED